MCLNNNELWNESEYYRRNRLPNIIHASICYFTALYEKYVQKSYQVRKISYSLTVKPTSSVQDTITKKNHSNNRSSRLQMFFKIDVLRKFCRFHRKTPVLESLFNNVAGLKFFYRTPSSKENLRWLLLKQ